MAETRALENNSVKKIKKEDPNETDFDLHLPSALVAVKMEVESDEEPSEANVDKKYNSEAKIGVIKIEGVDANEKIEDCGANVKSDLCDDGKSTHCFICDVRFANVQAFEVHSRTCKECVPKEMKRYHCDLCGVDLSTPSNMRQHRLAVHLKSRPHVCNFCNATFAQGTNLRMHLRYHTGERPYKCNQCEKGFASNKDLKTHLRFHSGERPYQCEQCGQTFVTLGDMKVHQRKHTGECPYVCSWCDEAFPLKRKLVLHERRLHTGERPYECEVCTAAFTTSCALKVHIRSHTGEHPFQCSDCPARYTDRSNLRAHRRRCHTHAGERPFACTQCGASFTSRWTLRVHAHTHSDARPWVCTSCPQRAAFKTRSALNKHRRKCADRKYFACDMCDEKFIAKEKLRVHILKHADSSYRCTECERVCTTPSGLTQHMKDKHCKSEHNGESMGDLKRVATKEEVDEDGREVVKIEDTDSSLDDVKEIEEVLFPDCEIIEDEVKEEEDKEDEVKEEEDKEDEVKEEEDKEDEVKEEEDKEDEKKPQVIKMENVSGNAAELVTIKDESD